MSQDLYWSKDNSTFKAKIYDKPTIKNIFEITNGNNKLVIRNDISEDCIQLFESLCNTSDIPEEWYEFPKWKEFANYHQLVNNIKFYKYDRILDNVIFLLLENYPFNNMIDDNYYGNIVDLFYFLNNNRQTYDIHKYFYYRFITIKDSNKRLNVMKNIMQSDEFINCSLEEKIQISNEFLQIIDDNISNFSDERITDIFCKHINNLEKEVNSSDLEKIIKSSKTKNLFVNGFTKDVGPSTMFYVMKKKDLKEFQLYYQT